MINHNLKRLLIAFCAIYISKSVFRCCENQNSCWNAGELQECSGLFDIEEWSPKIGQICIEPNSFGEARCVDANEISRQVDWACEEFRKGILQAEIRKNLIVNRLINFLLNKDAGIMMDKEAYEVLGHWRVQFVLAQRQGKLINNASNVTFESRIRSAF